MPSFFQRICGTDSNNAINSLSHLNAQRANGITQVLGTTVESAAPSSVIATKFAQFLISLYLVVIVDDARNHEKAYHCLQGLIALGQFGLAVTLLFANKDCANNDNSALCNANDLLQYLYAATLLLNWTAGEVINGFSSVGPVVVEPHAPSISV